MSKIVWKISKETGNKKAPDPSNIKANEMAEVVFQPQQPFVVDSFKNCEGLGRIAIMEGATVVMLGKVVECTADDGKPPEDPKASKKEEPKKEAAGGGAAPAKGGAAPAKGGAQPAAKPAAKPPAKK